MDDIALHPISVLTDGGSHQGQLVLSGGHLVAVLTRLSAEDTSEREGWFLEAGFGPCSSLLAATPPLFTDLEEAMAWVQARLLAPHAHS